MKYKAVIFDMDGLLLDTERIALDAFIETCERFDLEPDMEVYMKCIGTNNEKTREIFSDGFGPSFSYDAFSKVWFEKYRVSISNNPIPVKSGAIDLLEYLQQLKFKTAVATSTEYKTAVKKLTGTELKSYFKNIVGGDQVEKGKPDPEIYLKVSTLLAEDPKDCLVLEDSDNGVIAASGAGMDVIQIPDLKQPSEKIKDMGHMVLTSLNDVKRFLENT
ncbi:HAD family hydrolase [Thermodesulfobacteriota bacterium]